MAIFEMRKIFFTVVYNCKDYQNYVCDPRVSPTRRFKGSLTKSTSARKKIKAGFFIF